MKQSYTSYIDYKTTIDGRNAALHDYMDVKTCFQKNICDELQYFFQLYLT